MFELINGQFQLDSDLMAFAVMRHIWERDPTNNHEEAFAYLSFIFHFYNPKSTYYAYPEDTRRGEIISREFPERMRNMDNAMATDTELIEAGAFYLEHLQLSPYRSVIDTAKQALQSMSITIKNTDQPMDTRLSFIKKITMGMEELKKAEKFCNEDEINSKVKGSRIVKDRER